MFAYLRGDASTLPCRPVRSRDGVGDEDLQLALYCCYELHYRGFESVSDAREWDPDVLRFRDGLGGRPTRALLDTRFPGNRRRSAMRDAGALIEQAILESEGPSLSGYLADEGSRAQFAEFVVRTLRPTSARRRTRTRGPSRATRDAHVPRWSRSR